MLSRSQIKYIRTLRLKKYRQKHGVYIAEGEKLVEDLLGSNSEIRTIFYQHEWGIKNKRIIDEGEMECIPVSAKELLQISQLKNPNLVLAIVEMPDTSLIPPLQADRLYLALDEVRDPGNMGTIIRTADWFGIGQIFCSEGCVDVFNPKVVQATMGSMARVAITYTDLHDLFSSNASKVYGAVLNGISLYSTELAPAGFLVIGNEANGIREALLRDITHPLTIPSFGGAESLNAAVSSAIILSEFRRQSLS